MEASRPRLAGPDPPSAGGRLACTFIPILFLLDALKWRLTNSIDGTYFTVRGGMAESNTLYYGDNLDILRLSASGGSVCGR